MQYNKKMSLLCDEQANYSLVEKRVSTLLLEALEQGVCPVLLVPSYPDTVAWKKTLAESENATLSLGVTVETVNSWMKGMWELFGDGRKVVDQRLRTALIFRCVSASDALSSTPGVIDVISSLSKEYLPFLGASASLSQTEQSVVQAVFSYAKELEKQRYCEESQVAYELAGLLSESFSIIAVGFSEDNLKHHERYLLKELGATLVVNKHSSPTPQQRAQELIDVQSRLFDPDPAHVIAATGAVRFIFAAGPSSENRLIAEAVAQEAVENPKDTVILVDKDPYALFSAIAPLLQERGIGCQFTGSRPIFDIDISRSIRQILEIIEKGESNTFLATDYTFNPFSGVSKKGSYYCDQRWRSDRLVSTDDILTDLSCNAAELLQGIVGSFENDRALEALDALRAYCLQQGNWSDAYKSEQLAALSEISAYFEAFESLDCSAQMSLSVLEQVRIRVSAQTGDGQVKILTLEEAASLEPGSASSLILTKMTTQNYPLAAQEGALHELLSKFELRQDVDPIARTRDLLYRALEVPRTRLIIERALISGTAKQESTYPAFLNEEIADCYRTSLSTTDDLDKLTLLPGILVPDEDPLGEEYLIQNRLGIKLQKVVGVSDYKGFAYLDDEDARRVMLPKRQGEEYLGEVGVSPSNIEAYLSCPYKWFIERRIGCEQLDETFGPLEKGNFVHATLQTFYASFQAEGNTRITAGTLEYAKKLLDQVFNAQLHKEREKSFKENRYIPLSSWEKQQSELLLFRLKTYLEREAGFLPGYDPLHFEWRYGLNRSFNYAGVWVDGFVDRIDVDKATGQAVVIDYKTGSIDEFALYVSKNASEFELPKKVQALIYAKAVCEVLGYEVVATLYVNPLTGKVNGGYDENRLKYLDIPGFVSQKGSCVPFADVPDFQTLLARVEEGLTPYIENMAQGVIEPNPRSKTDCKHCRVVQCDRRLDS